MQEATLRSCLQETLGRAVRMTNGPLQPPCISEMPSTEGEGLSYLSEEGRRLRRLICGQRDSALTPVYMARSTETPGRFNVLIWASGLLFSILFHFQIVIFCSLSTTLSHAPQARGSPLPTLSASQCRFIETQKGPVRDWGDGSVRVLASESTRT